MKRFPLVLLATLVSACGSGSGGGAALQLSGVAALNSGVVAAAPGELRVRRGSGSLPARRVPAKGRGIPALQLEFEPTVALTLQGITLAVQGDLDDAAELGSITLVDDQDGDGRASPSEAILARGRFRKDNGELSFSSLGLDLVAASGRAGRRHLLFLVDLAAEAASRRMALRLARTSQMTQAGLPVARVGEAVGAWLTVGSWSAPVSIQAMAEEVLDPKVVRDSQGNLHMTFFRNHNMRSDVYYSFFNGRFWSEPTNVSNTSPTSWLPAIAVGPTGEAAIAWEEVVPGNQSRDILVSRFDAGAFAWTKPENITNSQGEEGHPSLTVTGDGSIHVVWEDSSGAATAVVYRRFDGQRWLLPEPVSRGSGRSVQPAIAAEGQSTVHVVWQESGAQSFALRYRPRRAGVWEPGEEVYRSAGVVSEPSVCLSQGVPHVSFSEAASAMDVRVAARSGGRWQAPVLASAAVQGSENSQLIAGRQPGELILSWTGLTAAGVNDIFSARFDGLGWSRPLNISHSGGISSHPSAALVDGRPLVCWMDRSSGRYRILESHVDGTGWERPEDLTLSPSEVSDVRLAPDLKGGMHAVWHGDAGGNFEIYHAHFDGVSWSHPENISRSPGASYKARVAVTPDGLVHVLYEDPRQGVFRIVHMTGRGGVWSRGIAISASGRQAYAPELAVDGAGKLLAVWSEQQTGGSFDIVAAGFAAGAWAPSRNLSQSSSSSFQPSLSLRDDGQAAVAWEEDQGGRKSVMLSSFDGQVWAAPELVGPGRFPSVALETSGAIHLAVNDEQGGRPGVRVLSRPKGASFAPSVLVSGQSGEAYTPQLKVTTGGLVLVWEDKSFGEAEVVVSELRKSGWTAPLVLSGSKRHSNRPAIAVDRGGVLHVAWHEREQGANRIRHVSRRSGG